MAEEQSSKIKKLFEAEENSAVAMDDDRLNRYENIATAMFNTRVLSAKEMLFPALADFAGNMINGLNTYKKIYYLQVLKIDMVYIVAIEALISIYDVLNNPLMGAVYDKTRTRWGKARPYLLFTPLPFFLSTAILYLGAMFIQNDNYADPKKIIFVFLISFIQETFSTIYGYPKGNIATLMTPNPKDRITMGLLTSYASDFGAGIVYTLFMPIQDLNRWGVTNIPMSTIFAVMGIFATTIGVVGNMAMAFGVRERIILQPKPAPLTKSLFYILKNKYSLRIFAADFATSWFSTGGYTWDVVTQLDIMGGAFRSTLAYWPNNIVRNICVALVPRFLKYFGDNKRKGVLAFRLFDIVRALMQTLFGIKFINKPWLFILQFAIFWAMNGADDAPAMVMEAEMEREINDYTEYVTGERPDGTYNILKDLIMKITAPLGSLFTIWAFKWTGYDATKGFGYFVQGDVTVYKKLYFLYMFGWSIPAIVKLIPVFFYDIVGEKREKMYVELNERRALIATEQKDKLSDEMQALVDMIAEEETAKVDE